MISDPQTEDDLRRYLDSSLRDVWNGTLFNDEQARRTASESLALILSECFPAPTFEVKIKEPSEDDKRQRIMRFQVIKRPTITIEFT